MDTLKVLLEVTVYSAVIFAAIMLFKKANKNKLSPVLNFALWFLLIARLCVPVTLHSGFNFIVIEEKATAQDHLAADGRSVASVPGDSVQPAQDSRANGGAAGRDESGNIPAALPTYAYTGADVGALPPTSAPASVVNIYDILLMVWITVAFLLLMWNGAVSSRLDDVVRKRSVPAPRWIRRIYNGCCRELGVKRQIPVLVTQNIASPALIVSLRPKLLLPLDFIENSSTAQISFAIRHELTHYKRKDHIVCMLIRILNAVYWFNPVVWLAEKQIILDMETACDSSTVKAMCKEDKRSYANTILSMFAGRRRSGLVLGMALKNSKNIAERRIRGIYMKRKTKNSVKIASFLLVAAMLVACFTTACQPVSAQNEPQVVEGAGSLAASGKTAKSAESAAPADKEDSEPKEQEDEAEPYVDTSVSGKVTFNYDAQVVEPSVPLPVADVAIRDFTEADVQKVADYFFDGMETYSPWERTKDEIQQEIDALEARNKELLAIREEYESDPDRKASAEAKMESADLTDMANDPELEAYMEYGQAEPEYKMNEYYINQNKEALESAPDTREKTPAVIKFEDENLGRVGGVESGVETLMDEDIIWNTARVWAERPNGDISEVYGFRKDGGKQSSISYNRRIYTSDSGAMLDNILPDQEKLTMPQEEAQRLAEDAAAAICPELKLVNITINNGYDSAGNAGGPVSFSFHFLREINGVPITYSNEQYYYIDDDEDPRSIMYEQISVTVDNDGISSFLWSAPYSDIQATEEDAQVISLEEAQKSFEDYCVDGLTAAGYLAEEGTELEGGALGWGIDSVTFDIDKIQLGLTRIGEEDGEFRIVPTWDFFGTVNAEKDGEAQRYNSFGYSLPNASQGTINALDGTPVDRSAKIGGGIARW